MLQLKKNILYLFSSILLIGCSVNYSFTGASISDDIHTVSIKTFDNVAPLANPNYSQLFTESLRDIFLNQTNLTQVRTEGDLQFEGTITQYKITSVAIQGNEQAALNRLSVTVNVKFTNTQDDTQSFESSFTRFSDFESSQNLTSVEDALLKDINDQLTQDIFNKSVSNW